MRDEYILITGGAGFIGTNVALSYLRNEQPVHIFDNLARPGVDQNVGELLQRFPGRVHFTNANVTNRREVERAVAGARAIYHLAAQVAVTTSLDDPISDLETNLIGTLHILEAVRRSDNRPGVLFTSTNKVYGRLRSIPVAMRSRRYEPADDAIAQAGVSEEIALEFLSPYGCSKGSADQYVLDYAHSYGIHAAVFRMSCIYGTYQLGSEDQGWVAHFLRQALKQEEITIYGDGKQVRDLLFVDDLVRAMHLAHSNMSSCSGEVFNIGGGIQNSTSLLELIDLIAGLTGQRPAIKWGPERLADQRWFVADTSKAREMLGWRPEVTVRQGLNRLRDWYAGRPSLVERSAEQVA